MASSLPTLAVVPARGGSKRIPRKNIRPFLGKPILARVLEQLAAAACFSEIMVSTDDAEIAALARAHGAAVPFMRSSETAGDTASTAAVLLEVLAAYGAAGRQYARLCCAYPTAVFLTPELLRRGLRTLEATGADSVVTVLRYSTPVERALHIEEGRLRMVDPAHVDTRSVDLQPAYHDAGQCYWLRTTSFLEQKTIFARHAAPLVLDPMEAHDIDNEEDWRVAEFKFSWGEARRRG